MPSPDTPADTPAGVPAPPARRRRRAVTLLAVAALAVVVGAVALTRVDPEPGPGSSAAEDRGPAPEEARAPSPTWEVEGDARVDPVPRGRDDGRGHLVEVAGDGPVRVARTGPEAEPATAPAAQLWRLWVRSDREQPVTLLVEESADGEQPRRTEVTRTPPAGEWFAMTLRTPAGTPPPAGGAPPTVQVVLDEAAAGDRVELDGLEAAVETTYRLENGCVVSARGVPECGALLGAAVGGNDSPERLEEIAGQPLGLRRTYYQGDEVERAVRTAHDDLDAGRVPWISFKLPGTWAEMDSERGEAWVRDVARRLATLPGPVWVAFHHEPERDGDIAEWTRVQERFVPVVRSVATNVAYTVVLTGYNQLYGPPEFALDRMFPQGPVDVAAFDVYNAYGQVKGGRTNTAPNDVDTEYFAPLSAWARERGVAWGLGETGYADPAIDAYPDWIQGSYADLVARGGVAYAYFDSTLNSIADWDLSDPRKEADFADALRRSPALVRW